MKNMYEHKVFGEILNTIYVAMHGEPLLVDEEDFFYVACNKQLQLLESNIKSFGDSMEELLLNHNIFVVVTIWKVTIYQEYMK